MTLMYHLSSPPFTHVRVNVGLRVVQCLFSKVDSKISRPSNIKKKSLTPYKFVADSFVLTSTKLIWVVEANSKCQIN